MISTLSAEALAFALTYLLHSTLWIAGILLLMRLPHFQRTVFRNQLWRIAILGGLFSSLLSFGLGPNPQALFSAEKLQSKVASISTTVVPASAFLEEDCEPRSEQLSAAAVWGSGLSNDSELNESSFISYSQILLGLFFFWGLISLSIIAWHIARHRNFLIRMGRRESCRDEYLLSLLAALLEKAGISHKVKLEIVENLQSPVVLFPNEICLPRRVASEVEREELEAMIAHELAHIKRGDLYWSLFLAGLQSLFFFQPLLQLARMQMERSNELLCDAEAGAYVENPLAVANCLMRIAEWKYQPGNSLVLAQSMSRNPSELRTRVQSLIAAGTDIPKAIPRKWTLPLFLAIALLFCLALPSFILPEMQETEEVNPRQIVDKVGSYYGPISLSAIPNINLEDRLVGLSEKKRKCAYLLQAIDNSHPCDVAELLKTTDPNCLYCGGDGASSPLNAAVRQRNLQICKLLLEAGADVNHKARQDEGAILAAARSGDLEIMKLLLQYGAQPDQEISDLGSPLSNAIAYEQEQMVKLLSSL